MKGRQGFVVFFHLEVIDVIIIKYETPEDESPGACFCLLLLFTEIEQKNFISLL